jgi:DNA-binding transcriptional LysR family regulator
MGHDSDAAPLQLLRHTGAEAVGPLRVSAPATFGRLCVGTHIAGFLQQRPRVSLDLVLSESYVDLATERTPAQADR